MFPFLAVYLLEGVLLPLPWISIHEVPQKECLYWGGVTCSVLARQFKKSAGIPRGSADTSITSVSLGRWVGISTPGAAPGLTDLSSAARWSCGFFLATAILCGHVRQYCSCWSVGYRLGHCQVKEVLCGLGCSACQLWSNDFGGVATEQGSSALQLSLSNSTNSWLAKGEKKIKRK